MSENKKIEYIPAKPPKREQRVGILNLSRKAHTLRHPREPHVHDKIRPLYPQDAFPAF